jgi:predicted nucleotidyltransferase
MLDFIVKSKIRQRLLLLFMYNPGREYYINEAARLVKTSAGTAQRELEKLAGIGVLKKEKRANLAYFQADEKNPLYRDIKNIVAQTIGIEPLLKDALSKNAGIKFAFLFGSYAKGGLKPDSDIDLYVIGDIKDDWLYRAMKNVEEKIKREINYHLAAPAEFKKHLLKSFFHQEILSHYKLLTGDPHEFRRFIKRTA